MAFYLRGPSIGPIGYSKRIGGKRRSSGKSGNALAKVIMFPLMAMAYLMWWSVLAMYWIMFVLVYTPIKAAIKSTHVERTEIETTEAERIER